MPDPASLGLPIAPGGMWIRLTIGSVTRLGYGDAGTKKGHDAVKEAIGDALRNAAMRFGVALALWAKGDREWARHGGASLDATTQTQATPVDDRDAAQVEADTIREQILEWAKVNHRDPSTVAAAFAAEYNTPIQDAAANILEIFFQDRLIEAEQARVAS